MNQLAASSVLVNMANGQEVLQSEYQRLRAQYDEAFARLRSAEEKLLQIQQVSTGGETEREAARKAEEAMNEYRECRDRLVQYLATLPESGRHTDTVHPGIDQVRDLAYRLWEEAGRPPGASEDYWYRAERMLRHHS